MNVQFPEGSPEQREFMLAMQEITIQDTQRMFNQTSEKCFIKCVKGFRNSDLDKTELNCQKNCTTKFLKAVQRATMRFAEENQRQAQQGQR